MGRFSVTIPDDLEAAVRERADREGISLAAVARQALGAWCIDGEGCTTDGADRTALVERAVAAEAVVAERAVEIARLREDLAAERERSRRDVIEAAALAVRAALPGPAPPRESLGDRLRAFFRRGA